jgi:hypothetical protein
MIGHFAREKILLPQMCVRQEIERNGSRIALTFLSPCLAYLIKSTG